MTSPKVEPPKDDTRPKLRIDIEQCFVGHNFPNTEIVDRIEALIKLQQEALISKVEATINDITISKARDYTREVDALHREIRHFLNKLRLEL